MTLRQKQSEFAHDIGLLILFAYSMGYELTLGDAARIDRKGHCKNSKHYQRLAIDLNLFHEGKYLTKTDDHAFLGWYWKAMGHKWGGDFKRKDGNHYEY